MDYQIEKLLKMTYKAGTIGLNGSGVNVKFNVCSITEAVVALPSPSARREHLDLVLESATPESIVEAILRGDRNAEVLLYKKYYRTLHFILKRKCRDADLAKDLCQDTFEKAITNVRAGKVKDHGKLSSYIHGIGQNVLRTWLRKNQLWNDSKGIGTETVESIPDPAIGPVEEFDQNEINEAVRRVILEMKNARYREVLYCYYIREWDKKRICKDLKLDNRHFDRILFNAKNRFRQLLLKTKIGKELQKRIEA